MTYVGFGAEAATCHFLNAGGKLLSATGRYSSSMSASAGCGKNRKCLLRLLWYPSWYAFFYLLAIRVL